MKTISQVGVLCHLKYICIGLTVVACVFLIVCCGCGKKEEVAENPVEFKEIVATEAESQTGIAVEGTVSLDAKRSETKQPNQSEKIGQANQPVVKPVAAQDIYIMGLECFDRGRLEEAIKAFNKATDMDATMVDAHKKKASAYSKLGMMDEAIASFRKVVELNPNDAEPCLNLGTLYAKRQMTDDAIQSFERYISLNTNNAKVYYNLGCLYGKKKQTDRAIANYMQAVKINPNYVDAYYNLGTAYNEKGMFDEAIDTFKKLLALNADNNEAQYNLAFACNQKGLYNDAVVICGKLLEQTPENAYAHLLLGDTYVKLGKLKEAKDAYGSYKKLILVK